MISIKNYVYTYLLSLTAKVKNYVQIKRHTVPEDVVALLPGQRFVEPRARGGVVIMWGLLVAMAVSCTGLVLHRNI